MVIDGMPGVGKTALTIRAARELAGDYRDAQLFLDMGSHADHGAVMSPAAALGHLLTVLGVPADDIPAGLGERAAFWRARLRTRRAVIVLDDVLSSAQIRPLLPDTTNCLVLINSRHRLAGLDEVRTVSLDVLTAEQGRSLFARALGDERAADEPLAVSTVVRLCGGLPLAILIAAARLRHRPGWRVTDLADRLADGDRLLDLLRAEDRSVSSALLSSYARLTTELRRFFRSLGEMAGDRIDLAAAAALTGVPENRAEQALDALADRHFVEPAEPGSYRVHGLVRAYARALAHGALTRMWPVEPFEQYARERGGAA
ncbi:NB-ARC domain-containing protein [Amycolatopsis sp. NPDC058986]|uniref:NB-ARC domain-containing protein n=1 Tax=unclassified Amycolatopsis TaxID=2618356 RepID=UPI0036717FCF